jgi:chromosome segregation ATPase
MRANDQAQPVAPVPQRQAPVVTSPELAESIARYSREVEQLHAALERAAFELQSTRSSEAELTSRCESLEITVSSQELQLQAMLSQSASEKSLFLQEKERLQLLFDKQQQLCVGLTAQVVALTANCERLQSQVDCNAITHQLESVRHAKEVEAKEAVIAFQQKKCLNAESRVNDLEIIISDLQSKLDSAQSLNDEQTRNISLLSQQLETAARKISNLEQDALVNGVHTLRRINLSH